MEFTAEELAQLQTAAQSQQERGEKYVLHLIKQGGLNIPQIAALTGMPKRDIYNLKRRHKMHDPVYQAKLALFRERKRTWVAAYREGVEIRVIAHNSGVDYQTVYNVLYAAGVLRRTIVSMPTSSRKERDAEIFRLRAAGETPMEISKKLNIKINTLRAVLRRAKLKEAV